MSATPSLSIKELAEIIQFVGYSVSERQAQLLLRDAQWRTRFTAWLKSQATT